MSNTTNGIKHYLKSFYRFVTSFNNAQAGFVGLADSTTGLLAYINKKKTKELGKMQDKVNEQAEIVKGFDIEKQKNERANAEKDFTKLQDNLKQKDLEYSAMIQALTPTVTAVQQQVKTNSAGAAMLPQIGEAVLAILSKAVELASSIRV